jgi:hypothetical protein
MAATSANFQNMLNQYLPLDLLKQELIKRDYLMQRVQHDESWKGGAIQVPFELQYGSSVEFGQLAGDTDIAAYAYSRGTISTQPEVWASLQFLHKDLVQHDGKIPESTFLRILPDQVDAMLSYLKMVLSVHLMGSDGAFAVLTADGDASGHITVDRPDRFTLSQKIALKDGNTAVASYYVTAIDINTKIITVSATRGGAAADVSAYTTAQSAKVYHPGSTTAGMTSLGSQLLTSGNGGSASLFGVTKTSAPFLQCPNIDGTGVSATNILSKIFDGYTQRMILAKSGNIPEVVLSFKHFGSILKLLETNKGAYNIVPNSRKVSVYGWQTVEIGSVSGAVLKIVGIQEMPDELIYFLDWDGITFFSNGLIRRRKSPDGIEYHATRATSGYSYIIDHFVMGDLVCTAPWKQAVMYGVPNY